MRYTLSIYGLGERRKHSITLSPQTANIHTVKIHNCTNINVIFQYFLREHQIVNISLYTVAEGTQLHRLIPRMTIFRQSWRP